jgi:hypothetical protein
LPTLEKSEDLVSALGAIAASVATGNIALDEATAMVGILEAKRKALETVDLERRLGELERRSAEKR